MTTVSTQPETAGSVSPREHETSETTSYEDELAYVGIGRRAIALFLDSIVLFAAFWVVGYVIGALSGGLVAGGFDLTGAPALVAMLAWFAIGFGYFVVLEARSGQTLGKRLTGLRVVNEDGSPITMSTSIVRNGLRIIDGLMVYAVGAVSIAISGKNQRLGDHVANTVVVRSK